VPRPFLSQALISSLCLMSVLFVSPIPGGKVEKFIDNRLRYEEWEQDQEGLFGSIFAVETKATVSLIRELPAFRPRSFPHPHPI